MSAVSETLIPVADPQAVMHAFEAHLRDEHEIAFERGEGEARFFQQSGFRIDFEPEASGLRIRLEGPSADVLIFLKEEIAEHVGEVDPAAAAAIRWTGVGVVAGALPSNFRILTVKRAGDVFSGMRRITFSSDDVSAFDADGVHLRMMMPLQPGRTPAWPIMGANGAPVWPEGQDKLHARFMTIRHVRVDEGEIDVDVVRHAGGLISDWAAAAEPGWSIGAMGPAGDVRPAADDGLFLAADGTGLPAIARVMERAPSEARGNVVVALPDGYPAERYLPRVGLEVHTIPPERFEAEILHRAVALTAPGQTRYALFCGEFTNAQALRELFKTTLGLGKGEQISAAYWKRGVPGHGS